MPKDQQRKARIVLVLGAARSGKSTYAQRLAEMRWRRPLYLATAEALDEEMAERIKNHKRQRGRHWSCIEEPQDLARAIAAAAPRRDGVLIDCVTLWLSNVLLKEGVAAVKRRQRQLLEALRSARHDVILVSNEVGMGVVPDSALGRQFRDLQGWLNQDLATAADTVVFVVAGLPMAIKGQKP